jgi:hypothetical protein
MIRTVLVSLVLTSVVAAQTGQKPATDTKPAEGKALEVTVPSYANATCPHMPKPSKPEIFVDTPHGRVNFCCKVCLAKAKKNPEEAYAKAYPTTEKIENKTDPVDGKPVKAGATVIYRGYEINLSDAKNAQAVVANGDVYVTLLTKPALKDVKNAKDPVTDQPVVDNVFVIIGTSLVHLSSADSVEAIRKDPAKALEKAEKSAKKS